MVKFIEPEEKDPRDFFIKHQAETAGKAGEKILKLLGNAENLFLLSEKPEDMAKYDEAYQSMLSDILEVFEEHKVGQTNYNYVFEGIKSVVSGLQQYMLTHAVNLKKEIDSRFVGAKNPLTGKYDIDHATHADLISAVIKIRQEQGDNPEDYFTIVPKEEQGPVSSIQREDLKK